MFHMSNKWRHSKKSKLADRHQNVSIEILCRCKGRYKQQNGHINPLDAYYNVHEISEKKKKKKEKTLNLHGIEPRSSA